MSKLNIGIIGAGRIGKLHTDNLLRMPEVSIRAIADPFIDKVWANNRGLNVASSADEIFSDSKIQAVLILSPSTLHAEQIVKAARAGKHIFCEKPIALDPAKIKESIKEAEDKNVKLQIGFNRRFDPNFKKLKDEVAMGKIGDLYMIKIISRDPAPPAIEYVKESGGIFLDMTIHDFDMVRYLSGSEVSEVFASGAVLVNPQIGEAGDIDTAITTLKLTNGALASIDNCRQAAYGYDQRIEVFGARGSIAANNCTKTQTVFSSADGVIYDKPLHFFLERYADSFMLEMKEFVHCVVNDKTPPVTGQDGLAATQIGLAARKSYETNKPVNVG